MECAAYRHRWVLAYRKLCGVADVRLRFEPVRVASWDSWQKEECLTDEQIAARVEELTR